MPTEGTSNYVELFEAFIVQEVYRLNQYFEKDFRLSFLRTKNGAEVDLILSKPSQLILIEIKSSRRIDEVMVRKLAKIGKDFPEKRKQMYYLSQDSNELEPYVLTKKRKAIQKSKFYFFNTGVTFALLNIKNLDRESPWYGNALEQWVFMELRAYLSYRRMYGSICFWRSVNGQEVDFIIGDRIGIEVKAKSKVQTKDFSSLNALSEEKGF